MTQDDIIKQLRRALRGEELTMAELIDLRIAVREHAVHNVHNMLAAALEIEASAKMRENLP